MPFSSAFTYFAAREDTASQSDLVFAPNLPVSNVQSSLSLTFAVVEQGIYPSRDTGFPGGIISLGYVTQWAANFAPRTTSFADGGLRAISTNTALFSIIGTTYGGDGRLSFGLPDLEGNLAVGAGSGTGLPVISLGSRFGTDTLTIGEANLPTSFGGNGLAMTNYETSQGVNYVIHTAGSLTAGSANFAGSVHMFLGNFDPNGALICDGRLLSISAYPDLFAAIGTIYGGDGITNFRIPDLRGRTIVGADEGLPVGTYLGTPEIDLTADNLPSAIGGDGDAIDNQQPGVVMQVLVAYQGIYPSRSQEPLAEGGGDVAIVGDTAYLSQIVFFAGTGRPTYFYPAQGQILPINTNQALFSLLGTNYGGDGRTTFALPDFGGRSATGFDVRPGETSGSDDLTIAYDNVPGRSQTGDDGNDDIIGSDGNDVFLGEGGYDVLIGNGGDDWLSGGDQIDTLDGGAGNDVLNGGRGADTMIGGTGDDFYDVVYYNDTIVENAGEGIDTVRTSVASYTLPDNFENLVLFGGRAVTGNGNQLDNTIEGSSADNVLNAGGGNDIVYGYDGDDTIRGGNGDDFLSGREGADLILGNRGADRMYGGDDADRLYGGDENDEMFGGSGDDLLRGGSGQDFHTGGSGADLFVWFDGEFAGLTGSTADRIYDFNAAEGDRIDLENVDAIAGTAGDDAFTFIGSAAFTGQAGELRSEVFASHTNVYGDVDGDGSADFAIRVDGTTPLTGADFIL